MDQTSTQYTVIKQNCYEGQVLDVAGLNRITVLVDRSQAALTEVGLNVWTAGIKGPPHAHDGKEQIFFVTGGTGTVTVTGEVYDVQPGDLVYGPAGAMHRTLPADDEDLAYLLFNAFEDSSKEGEASFAEHIEKAKSVRRRQADEAIAGAEVDWERTTKQGQFVRLKLSDDSPEPGHTTIETLLDLADTHRSAAYLLRGNKPAPTKLDLGPDTETTLFVLSGDAVVAVAGERYPVATEDVLFVPVGREMVVTTESDNLAVLCLTTHLD